MKNTIKMLTAMRSIAIIALIAVIGFGMAACDDGNKVTDPLNGTWTGDGGKMVLKNGAITISTPDETTPTTFVEAMRGTYTTSGSNITVTITQVKGATFNEILGPGGAVLQIVDTQWYTKTQMQGYKTMIVAGMVATGQFTQEQAEQMATAMLEGPFATYTAAYAISGKTLTVTTTVEGETETATYTKQ